MPKKLLLFVSLLGCSFLLRAQVYKEMKDTVLFKKKIDQMAQTTNSIESDFTQVKDLTALTEKVKSTGHFYFRRENLLRWEYNTPYKYIIVINKDKILIKDEQKLSKYDMNSNKVFKEINDILISCVQGNILKSGKFKIRYFENGKDFKLELFPLSKGMKESLKKINMYFDNGVSSVIRLEMIEATGDMTTIDFSNKKLNGTIPDSQFTLN